MNGLMEVGVLADAQWTIGRQPGRHSRPAGQPAKPVLTGRIGSVDRTSDRRRGLRGH